MAGRLQQIGSAFVRLFVKKDELDRGLSDARASVRTAADGMNADAQRVGGGFGAVGDRLNNATKGARGFVGALSGAVGIVTRLLGIVSLIGAAVGAVALAWDRVANAAERAAEESQKEIDKQRRLAIEVSQLAEVDKQKALERVQAEYDVAKLLEREAELLKRQADELARMNSGLGPSVLSRRASDSWKKSLSEVQDELRRYRALLDLINRAEEKMIEKRRQALRSLRAEQIQAIDALRSQTGVDSLVVSMQQLERAIRLVTESHYLNAYRL